MQTPTPFWLVVDHILGQVVFHGAVSAQVARRAQARTLADAVQLDLTVVDGELPQLDADQNLLPRRTVFRLGQHA